MADHTNHLPPDNMADADNMDDDPTTPGGDQATRMINDEIAVILDFHCFVDDDGNELIKELAIMDITAFASRHWIFAPPVNTIVSNHKHMRTNRWLTEHYHRLEWTDGDTSYDHLVSILIKYTFPFNCVFVKGLQKKRFLEKCIVHFNIINLEDFSLSLIHI